MIIIIISKVPTLRLRALNKHSITHIMYIEMEMLSAIKMYIRKKKRKKELTHNVDKGSSVTVRKMHTHTRTHARTHARTHTHAHTHACTHAHIDRGDGQCCLAEIF